MGLFSQILGKLGINKAAAASTTPAASANAGTSTTAAAPSSTQTTATPASQPAGAPAQPAAPAPMSAVDVGAKLDSLTASNPEKLNWKVSIVDLLKLLGIDSSLSARKELATELGCPPEKMGDSAQMNMWLHKAVLQKLSENGGQVPRELID